MPASPRYGSVAIALVSLLAGPAESQAPVRQPVVSLTGGLGNTLGGLGAGLEYYFAKSRVAASLAGGYWPTDVCASTFSGAVALRGFTGGRHHRGFLEGSYSLVEVACSVAGGQYEHHYGPGISAGYRYISEGGFTVTAGAGVADPSGETGAEALILLSLGYTWRKR
jgi:hypothetical protein